MPTLDLDTVRLLALIGAVLFVLGAVVSAVLLRTISQKLAVASIFVLLALLVWSQRASLETCAEIVRGSVVTQDGAMCTFFGREVEIPMPSRI